MWLGSAVVLLSLLLGNAADDGAPCMEHFGKVTKEQRASYAEAMTFQAQTGPGPRQAKKPGQLHEEISDRTFNFLVAGESGLGKTTFINTFFQFYRPDGVHLYDGDVLGATRLSDFVHPETRAQLQYSFSHYMEKVAGGGFNMKYTLQDTPGYGDDLNVNKSISVVMDHITEQHCSWSRHRSDAFISGGEPDPGLDTRYHVCLYFISPHRYRMNDLYFIEQLSTVCNVIPIIAKADSITVAEMERFRPHIMGMDGDTPAGVDRRLQGLGANKTTAQLLEYFTAELATLEPPAKRRLEDMSKKYPDCGTKGGKGVSEASRREDCLNLIDVFLVEKYGSKESEAARRRDVATRFMRFSDPQRRQFYEDFGIRSPPDGVFSVILGHDDRSDFFEQCFNVSPRAYPARVYPWGSAETFNPQQSDGFSLRMMLFEYGFYDIEKAMKTLHKKIKSSGRIDDARCSAIRKTQGTANKRGWYSSWRFSGLAAVLCVSAATLYMKRTTVSREQEQARRRIEYAAQMRRRSESIKT